jgi:hypothetical protein
MFPERSPTPQDDDPLAYPEIHGLKLSRDEAGTSCA